MLDQRIGIRIRTHTAVSASLCSRSRLWVLHARAHNASQISPILALVSPEKRCGKTTALGLVQRLVPRPMPASNITSVALFRATEKWMPTDLVGEVDTFLRDSDELRGILNSGRPGAQPRRSVMTASADRHRNPPSGTEL